MGEGGLSAVKGDRGLVASKTGAPGRRGRKMGGSRLGPTLGGSGRYKNRLKWLVVGRTGRTGYASAESVVL